MSDRTTASDELAAPCRPIEHVRILLRADRFAFTTDLELELEPAEADVMTGAAGRPERRDDDLMRA